MSERPHTTLYWSKDGKQLSAPAPGEPVEYMRVFVRAEPNPEPMYWDDEDDGATPATR